MSTPITIARGDGIGPEIMEATLSILERAGAKLDIEEIEIGKAVYERGVANGIEDSSWDSIRRTKVFLKAPITTPQGGGFKSLNVTIRKTLSLFANIRPVVALAPYVPTLHPKMDVVIVRENEEDLYAGIEHQQSDDVVQCLKIITRPGSERIMRYAFEYAKRYGRKKITCSTKDNIMKMTDGLFHKVFEEVGRQYPEIEQDHYIIDIGTARLADNPEAFDVMVLPNLYGDILSDVAAEIAGSVGMGVSLNFGEHYAMFEAMHGSAPDIAGHNIANPSGLLQSAVHMLVHVGQSEVATDIQNAWLKTLEDGIHTGDIYSEEHSTAKVGTKEFADAVCERLGQKPETLMPAHFEAGQEPISVSVTKHPKSNKELVGVDVFVAYEGDVEDLAAKIRNASDELELTMISNRGQKVWPGGDKDTFCVDVWRARYLAPSKGAIARQAIVSLLAQLSESDVDFVKTEGLFRFDGVNGFTVGQGQ